MDELSPIEQTRYAKQLLYPGWSQKTQSKLKNANVFIAGAGGLGCIVAGYLTAAGIGTLIITDHDKVELSNLNRQILYTEVDIGQYKVLVLKKRLQSQNPHINLVTFSEKIIKNNCERIIGRPDIVVDCLDNYNDRNMLNLYCTKNGIPLVYGGVMNMEGQVIFLHPPQTPCFRCIFPEMPKPVPIPVFGPTAGIIGSIQALEVIKHLTNTGHLLKNRLLNVSGNEMAFKIFHVKRNPTCPVCGNLENQEV